MSSTTGYTFYFKDGSDVLTFPITPGELKINLGSNNKTVTLINEGDINILKSPSLVEVEFEARFPMRKYPYSRTPSNFQTYFDKFKELKENKKSFRFVVGRTTLSGSNSWGTNLLVALEDVKIKESASEGDDVLVDIKLRQYKEYGIKTLPASTSKKTTSTATKTRPTESKTESTGSSKSKSSVYTVQSADCLWNIAKAAYGDATKWKDIYEANKTAIEADAKKHGRKSSSNGHWIWAGLKLTIPGVDNAGNLKVKKLW